MIDQSKKKKEWLVYRAWFFRRFKSKKGITLQCGQSHKEILPWKFPTWKEWA